MELTTTVKRFVHWHRRALAATLAGLAVLILLSRLAPGDATTVEVVVTSHALHAGEVVTAADVHLARLPPDSVPDGEPLELADVLGQSLSAQVRGNTVVQSGMLASGQVTGPGRALVPVMVTDEQLAQLLTPGTVLTLVHISETGFDVLTDDARVGALPQQEDRPALSPAGGRAPLLVVDVPAGVAPAVSVLGQRGELSIILGGG